MATISVPSTELHLVTLVGLQLQGQAPSVEVTNTEEPQDTPLILQGYEPSAEITHSRQTTVGSLALTGVAPERLVGNNVQPAVGSLSLTGIAPSAEIDHNRATGSGSLAITGIAPDPLLAHIVLPGVGALVSASDAPSAEIEHNRAAGAGSLALNGLQPVVLSGDNLAEAPGAGSLAFTGNAPSAEIDHVRSVGSDGLALATNAATIASSILVQSGSLALLGEDIEGSRVALPSTASVAITGIAPATEVANAGTTIVNANATAAQSNYEQCDYTGFRVLPGELVQTGYGKWVRPKSNEGRHPQDFARSISERRQRGPQRPEQDDSFVDTVTADEL